MCLSRVAERLKWTYLHTDCEENQSSGAQAAPCHLWPIRCACKQKEEQWLLAQCPPVRVSPVTPGGFSSPPRAALRCAPAPLQDSTRPKTAGDDMTLHGRFQIFCSPCKHVAAKFMFAYQACVSKKGLTHLTFLKKHTPGPGRYARTGSSVQKCEFKWCLVGVGRV